MPTSIDPQPGEDEIECARCGAIFFHQLTRCPNCGVDLYDPEDEEDQRSPPPAIRQDNNGILSTIGSLFRRSSPHEDQGKDFADAAQAQANLYEQLLRRVGGDYDVAGRLIDFKARRLPDRNRRTWLESAIRRWDRDNS